MAGQDPNVPEIVQISYDKLCLVVERNRAAASRIHDWQAPLGTAAAIWLIIPVTDFRDFVGMKANQWQLIIILCGIAATVWLGFSIKNSILAARQEDLVSELVDNADVVQDKRGLYVAKTKDNKHAIRVLVYFDIVWQCYLLPHADIRAWDLADTSSAGPVGTYCARMLGLEPENVRATPMPNLRLNSKKFSEFHKQDKSYWFEFIHIALTTTPGQDIEHLRFQQFETGGREFQWRTLA